jgi:hypothetical protein
VVEERPAGRANLVVIALRCRAIDIKHFSHYSWPV